MNAEHLARRLAGAANHTAAARAALAEPSPSPGVDDAAAVFVPIDPREVPTGWWAYGRAIWPLDDDITDDRDLVEGTGRRSYAALNHYLRQDSSKAAADQALGLRPTPPDRRLRARRRRRPRVTTPPVNLSPRPRRLRSLSPTDEPAEMTSTSGGWADDTASAAAGDATTADPLSHHPGPTAAYLGSWIPN